MNKTILITGAAKRIGKEIALTYSDLGWNIIIHYNSSKKDADDLANEINKDKNTGFHLACSNGHHEVLKVLLQESKEHVIDFNAKNQNGFTGFHDACSNNHPKVVQILLEESSKKKIDLNALNLDRKTGYHIALRNNLRKQGLK